MAIREDLVASAAQFLQDPSVAGSSLENRIGFLRSKNLTQEEIDSALARTSSFPAPIAVHQGPPPPGAGPPQQSQQYYQPYPQYSWQAPPPPPRRDWRDWFIMATVVSGVGYGLFELTKRYVYPMVAPPTPEKLEQDKKAIEEQFDKAFGLVEQLARDTEALKASERERTERLDTALLELETVINELKSANRRREDDAQRIRDDIQGLKGSIPKAMEAQKELTDTRLKEVNQELVSLKTLLSRINSTASSSAGTGTYLRQSNGNATPTGVKPAAGGSENAESEVPSSTNEPAKGIGRSSPLSSGNPTGKQSIPSWQLAASNKATGSSSGVNGEAAGSS